MLIQTTPVLVRPAVSNLELWKMYTKDYESNDNYLTWSYYSAIMSALKRDVWMTGLTPFDNVNCIFANNFLLYVGKPAAGKGRALGLSGELVRQVYGPDGKTRLIQAGPTSGSMQGLLKRLSEATYQRRMPDGKNYSYHCMSITSEELGVLLKKEDNDTVPVLQQLYDSRHFDKTTVTADCFDMEHVCMNLVSCTQPDWIKKNFSASLFGQGLMSRFIIIFADEPRFFRDIVEPSAECVEAKEALIEHLTKVAKLFGRVTFTPDALAYRREIIAPDDVQQNYFHKRVNDSQWLEGYYGRKRLHWFKLSMAMHFSESTEMVIDQPVMEAAYKLLEETEKDMDKAFKGIGQSPMVEIYERAANTIKKEGGTISRAGLIEALGDTGYRNAEESIKFLIETGRVKPTRTSPLKYTLEKI